MSQSIVINNLEDLENIRNYFVCLRIWFYCPKKAVLKLFYQLKAEQLYTIGDGENDICMLQCTDNSFIFNHVETVIKNSAQYHFDTIEQMLAFINQK